MLIKFRSKFTRARLRVRRVDEISWAQSVAEQALESDDWFADVIHGGGVANAYGYPAETECVLALSDPFGNVIVWCARAPANSVTERGAAEACVAGSGALFDGRVRSCLRKQEALQILQEEHHAVFPPMLVIASAAI